VDDRRVRLEQLRDQLALALGQCSENMLPQLAGQYRATLADIAALPPVVVAQSTTDEIRARREKKKAAPVAARKRSAR